MKIIAITIFLSSILTYSCNNANQEKDSVDIADSTNRANIDSPAPQQPIKTDEETASFLVKAADGAMAEVHLGGLAQQKGRSAAVKNFGSMMIHDHSAGQDKIKVLAAQKNVTLPATVSDAHQDHIDKLTQKSGADFDKAYMADMVRDHEEDIKLFENAAKSTTDSSVKTFINTTLPTLRMHLDSAKAIQKRIK